MLSLLLILSIFFVQNSIALNNIASYSNLWVDPDYILNRTFNVETGAAQNTISQWATILASEGPWSVIDKPVLPPSGDPHDYMSWAPYSFPNCSTVGNTTELPPEKVWTTCPYEQRDGVFNPDGRLINNIGHFSDLADAVLFNTFAWVLTNYTPQYSKNAAYFIRVWFIDEETRMNPHLKYSQMIRGPEGQLGAHTGILDLKCMAKIINGILILRKANSPDWTPELDGAMVSWVKEYISWLETWPTAYEESLSPNNHGSFFYSQFASLKILIGDYEGARQAILKYFATTWQPQVWANGEQPFEMIRTRPYHYRAYNLNAMITNARIGVYLGLNPWNFTTANNSRIQDACNFAMTIPPGDEAAGELFPNVADVAAIYGDPDGRYAAFLAERLQTYAEQPYFLWDQPFSDSGLMLSRNISTGVTAPSVPTATSTDGAEGLRVPMTRAQKIVGCLIVFGLSGLSTGWW